MYTHLQGLSTLLLSQAAQVPQEDPIKQMVPMLLIFVGVIYFMVIRPQSKERKTHQAMLDALMRGDDVITTSGILGKITDMDGTFVTLEIARNVKIRVLKTSISKKHTEATPPVAEESKSSNA